MASVEMTPGAGMPNVGDCGQDEHPSSALNATTATGTLSFERA